MGGGGDAAEEEEEEEGRTKNPGLPAGGLHGEACVPSGWAGS